ncbi:MAG: ATP-dependent DNA helicase RecG [Firmicutes bacterium]|nr:ATP-dependent DNA helicase RecG [Bacillota bacterium]
MRPEDDITAIAGVGPKKAEAYHRLGVYNVRDLLFLMPRDHQDRRRAKKISELTEGETALVRGIVVSSSLAYIRSRRGQMMHVTISDDDDLMDIVFFNARFLKDKFPKGKEMYFYGRVGLNRGRLQLLHPEFSNGPQGLLPIYPLTQGLGQGEIRKNVRSAVSCADMLTGCLPDDMVSRKGLMSIPEAVRKVHFPESPEDITAARERLIYEDLFVLQTGLLMMKVTKTKGTAKTAPHEEFLRGLSFELTGAQKKAVEDITNDMASTEQMNRLLQGDVGSGKTIVAEAAIFKAAKSGYQSAFMAPTDILARQHLGNLRRDLGRYGITVGCLLGSMTPAEKEKELEKLRSGETMVIVGTHALIQEGVSFADLGLVVTDEQHRFGVSQRMMLGEKGESPDILIMTATPIPRTLAVIMYGDMDATVIDEMPPGRKSIITKAVTEKKRDDVYRAALDMVRDGGQVYVVCPLIEDSDVVEARSAAGVYEELKKKLPGARIALLHGEMKKDEKEAVMASFAKGDTDILVSTVVIEVGIDVPNASVMIIENCERFGLAQMHQLRGRVGRGSRQSYCMLILGGRSEIAVERAKVMTESDDGFYIAEKDLDLRGPGEVFGTRQHGIADSHISGLISHLDIMEEVRDEAVRILKEDPELDDWENAILRERIEALYGEDMTMSM